MGHGRRMAMRALLYTVFRDDETYEAAWNWKCKKSQVQKVENATIGGHEPHSFGSPCENRVPMSRTTYRRLQCKQAKACTSAMQLH